MKKKIYLLSYIILTLFLSFPFTQLAKADNDLKGIEKASVKIDTDKNIAKSDDQVLLKEQKADKRRKSSFIVSGTITSLSDNAIVVSNQTIIIDLTKVPEFTQKGILAVGASVRIKGIIVGDIKYAEDVNVIKTGQGRFQFSTKVVKNKDSEVAIKGMGSINQIRIFIKQILSFLAGV